MAARRTTRNVPPFKPAVAWGALTFTDQVAVAAATKVLLGSFTGTDPATVRRTRGIVNWRSD